MRLPVENVPATSFPPLQSPEASHLSAFVVDQLNSALQVGPTELSLAEKVNVGAETLATVETILLAQFEFGGVTAEHEPLH